MIMNVKDVPPRDSYVDMLGYPMPKDTVLQRNVFVRYSSSSRITMSSLACMLVGGTFGASLGIGFVTQRYSSDCR